MILAANYAPVGFKLSAPLQPSGPVTINYTYDPLYRLIEANYSTGDYYHYTYDAVGNRKSQTIQLAVTNYQYDVANRLVDVNGVIYTWDNNGNLLSDGVNTDTYDSANRLTSLSNQSSVSSYQYKGLGDRLTQTVNAQTTNYTLDLNAGLTQVLGDGTNAYVYGLDRIAETNATSTDYFLADALGSVRQLTDASGDVTLAKSYDPYGSVIFSAGSGRSVYGYTSEQSDPSGLVFLRSRYYSPNDGRFTSKDSWGGNINSPMSYNKWLYVYGNPINHTDPSGHDPWWCEGRPNEKECIHAWVKAHEAVPDWWTNRSHLYIEGYGHFDVQHLDRGWRSTLYMEQQINALGPGGGTFPMTSKEYYAIYRVFANVQSLNKETKIGIMYGIYRDFEIGYEKYQARRLSKFNFPSAFSPEDLPSDHLGFWAYVNGYKKYEIPALLKCLGEVRDRGTGKFLSYIIDASYESNDNNLFPKDHDVLSMIYGSGYYKFSVPRNYEFLPMVTDQIQYENGKIGTQSRNIPWPSWLEIMPIPSGPTTWRKEDEGYIR